MSRRLLLIDNLDSFTFNLVEAIQCLGVEVIVLRHTVDAAAALERAQSMEAPILLSPGPGTPSDAGCCLDVVRLAKGEVPVIGICLGHQAIVEEAGGRVVRAPKPVHGKASLMHHDGRGPFEGLEGPIQVGRYHSLCTIDLPERFTVHAEVDGMAMAIADPEARQAGLQFHPESILTPKGDVLLRNILAQAVLTGA
jgi:anthranilate synthase/aminodeoxychorismate synthase-like glutamine amidotransferase